MELFPDPVQEPVHSVLAGGGLHILAEFLGAGISGGTACPATSSTAPVVLRYEEPSDERLFSRISIFAALLCLLGIAWGPRLPRVAWVSRAPRLRHASAAYAVGATLVVAGGLAYARQGPQLINTWRSAAPCPRRTATASFPAATHGCPPMAFAGATRARFAAPSLHRH